MALIVAIGSLAVRAFGLTKAANYVISLAVAAMEMAILRGCRTRSGGTDQIDFRQEHVDGNRQDHALPRQIFIPALHIATPDGGHVTAQP
jgi:hypothetical protein